MSSVLLEWLLCCFGNQESISLMATIQTKQSQHNSCLPARTDHHCPATDAASGTTPSAPTSATSEAIVVTCAEGYFTAAMATCKADDTWVLPDCTGAVVTGCAVVTSSVAVAVSLSPLMLPPASLDSHPLDLLRTSSHLFASVLPVSMAPLIHCSRCCWWDAIVQTLTLAPPTPVMPMPRVLTLLHRL